MIGDAPDRFTSSCSPLTSSAAMPRRAGHSTRQVYRRPEARQKPVDGIGTLQINNGMVQSGAVKIGEFADPDNQAYGEAILSGGTWNLGFSSITVGDAGNGKLNINSGTLQCGAASIGRSAGADGEALVRGTLKIDGQMTVGEAGTGRLRAENNAMLETVGGRIGGFDSFGAPDGEVVLNSASWINAGFLEVLRNGQLDLQNGTELEVNGISAGGNDPFHPTTQIDGPNLASRATASLSNSTWTNAGLLLVGNDGYGKLTVGEEGTLTNPSAVLAFFSGSNAEVEVRGGIWNNTGRLTVGSGGKAKLTVSDGGLLTSNTSIIADDASSMGTVIIEGTGSRWDNTGTLAVADTNGPGTQGTLIVRNGGEVTSAGNVSVVGKGVLGGNGKVAANVSSSATVDPGYIDETNGTNVAGALLIQGNYQQVTGKLKIDLGQSSSDKLQVTGNISLIPFFTDTVLQVGLVGNFAPVAGSSFDILDWGGSLSGTFTSMQLPTLAAGLSWDTGQLYTSGVISIAGPMTIPGDFSGDGRVDSADYVTWRRNGGSLAQYNSWRQNFGASSGAAGEWTTIPEPTSLPLIGIGILVLGLRTRRCFWVTLVLNHFRPSVSQFRRAS